jgi:hypothetical protein
MAISSALGAILLTASLAASEVVESPDATAGQWGGGADVCAACVNSFWGPDGLDWCSFAVEEVGRLECNEDWFGGCWLSGAFCEVIIVWA